MDINSLSLKELENLQNNIKEKKRNIIISTRANFDKKIIKLIGDLYTGRKEREYVRDYEICFPDEEKKHICIRWVKFCEGEYNNIDYNYKLKMLFNNEFVTINKHVVCSCFSPYFCSSKCYENKDKIDCVMAKYNVKTKTYQINSKIQEEEILEWLPRVFKIFEPLYKEFDNLYNGYFKDLDNK